jgi:biopolymer transport protein ExbB/TolQ
MNLLGSEILGKTLHLLSQSLLLPTISFLLIFIAYAVVELGSLFAEYAQRKKIPAESVAKFIQQLQSTSSPEELTAKSELSRNQKVLLKKIIDNNSLPPASLQALARKLIEEEELKSARIIEKTDLVARLGPALGLMGTLIPLGPGLAALSAGNIQGLAEAIIIAFDTTVVGLAAGGIAFLISRVRKRWYEEHLSTLEAVAESLLEVLISAKKKKTIVQLRERR